MPHKPVSGLAGIAFLFISTAVLPAQDFRVYTKIFDERTPDAAAKKTAPSRLVGRNTALFHAGRVYDSLDGGSQMTIFEPAHERFIVLDDARRTRMVIPFAFIEQRLYQEGKRTEAKIAELRGEKTPAANAQADQLEFQLKPKFAESFDDKESRLTLANKRILAYEAKCDTQPHAEVLDNYLNYAGWAARLNFLMNPRAMLPGPRLALNAALDRRKKLPIEVKLESAQRNGLHLRAEHRFSWKLDASDLSTITHWERFLIARDVKEVPPQEFFEPVAGTAPVEKLGVRR